MSRKITIPLSARRWIYSVTIAAVPLLIAYGVLDRTSAPLWVALAAAVISPGIALAHPTTADTTADWQDIDPPADVLTDPAAKS